MAAWGWSGGAKTSFILCHRGNQLILAYNWARPAILVVGKEGGCFYCPQPFRRKARGHGIRLCVVRDAWRVISSRYLVSSTPPTVLNRSFWNFTWSEDTHMLLYRILKLIFFFLLFSHLTDFFAWFRVCSGNLVIATPPSFIPILLKLHRYLNHGLKICMFFLQNLKIFFFHILMLQYYESVFHASILWKCIFSRYLCECHSS